MFGRRRRNPAPEVGHDQSTVPSPAPPALIDRARGALNALRAQPTTPRPASSDADLTEMIGQLGTTLLAASLATSDVEETLKGLADRYGRADLRIFVLPTLVMIEDAKITPSQTALFPADQDTLRLNQADDLSRLVQAVGTDARDPQEVIAAIARIRATPPRFGWLLYIIGYTLLTIGFGLVLNPTVTALPVYVVLGIVVGVVVHFGNKWPTLSLILPVVTAFMVTVFIAFVVRPIVHDDILRLVAPALVSFLPGLTLTIAAVELTSGQMMAGGSRLMYGIARLSLLTFGVFAGMSVSGQPPAASTHPEQLGAWAPWVGILLVSVGYYFYSAAPRKSLIWILYALVVAYSAQLLGNLVLGAELSGLVGALIAIPAVYLASKLKAAPTPAVMLTCAYWMLVPGAMGFMGLSEAASGESGATSTILRTAASLIAIAIGMLLGASFSRNVTAVAQGWRQGRRAQRTAT